MAADERQCNSTQPDADLITGCSVGRNNAQNTHAVKDQGHCFGLGPITHFRITPSALSVTGDLPLPLIRASIGVELQTTAAALRSACPSSL